MYLKSRKVAFLGLLTAVSVILIILGSVIEVSTLFFLLLAAFCAGIAIQEFGITLGFGQFVATACLAFIVAPNKIYCITYSAFAVYICAIELTYRILEKKLHDASKRNIVYVVFKFIFYNLIYLPLLFYTPELFYQGTISIKVQWLLILGGQVVFYLLDICYVRFMNYYCNRLRKLLKLN